jgi:hypothetical protein
MIRLSRAGEAVLTGMLVTFLAVSLLLLSQKGLFIDDSMHIPGGLFLSFDSRLPFESGTSATDKTTQQLGTSYRHRKPEAMVGNSIFVFR